MPYISDSDFLTQIESLQSRTFPARSSGNARDLIDAESAASFMIYEDKTLSEDAQVLIDGDWIFNPASRRDFVMAVESEEARSLISTLNEQWIDTVRLGWESADLDFEVPTSARAASRFALIRGKVLALEGSPEEFANAFQISMRLASLTETRLVAISYIVAAATRTSAINHATELAALGHLDNPTIRIIEADLVPIESQILKATADGERLFYSVARNDPDFEDPLGRTPREIFDDYESGYSWIVAKIESIDWEASDAPIQDLGGLGPVSLPFGGMLNVFLNERQSLAGLKAVIKIAKFRNAEGRLPTADEFQSPVDPANGEGFVYRPDTDSPAGFVLYSKGLDGIDNGGNFNDEHLNRSLMKAGAGEDHRVYPPAP